MKYHKLSKRARMWQRFNNWAYEFSDVKLFFAAFLFLISALVLFQSMVR